jgi:alpha-D-ribose 1-methylphosphonate 5-triphosphate diphosphatase
MAAAGITTVLDALRLGDAFEGCASLEAVTKPLAAIVQAETAGAMRAAHFLHLRCEIGCAETLDLFHQLVDTPSLRLVSVMDHTPGQRQFVDPEKLRFYYTKKYGMTDAEFDIFSARRIEAGARYSARHRAEIVGLARIRGRALASHDDATDIHVAEAVRDGMTVAEFPTTLAAARASHENGLAVMVGGPNLVLGGSHSGNIAARDLARAGCVDIVSSDYVPNSLMQAAFKLAAEPIGMDLPAAVRTVSLNPARSVGFDDRGALEAGQRADLVRVRVVDGEPVVRSVWRDGKRVV